VSREDKIKNFNPDENGLRDQGIFGLPFTVEESQIVLLPVPWEATVSYGEGTAKGPEAILKASYQIDLHDPIFPGGWKAGIAMEEISSRVAEVNDACRAQTELYLSEYGSTMELSRQAQQILEDANARTQEICDYVKSKSKALLEQGKFVGIVGGEHSVPLGYMQALADKHEYGILQIDAHADLRNAYEGFIHSHASIMYNAMQVPGISRLVQVGIRDYSEGEHETAATSGGKIIMYTDHGIKKSLYNQVSWNDLCDNIISRLPDKVYISFDIDGLQPWLCPNTGTPVPGGLLLEEAFFLLEKLALSGKKIIGFDLCEVSPGDDEWDGNVGSRVLYKLCLLAAKNNGISL
jgi:agmatinase